MFATSRIVGVCGLAAIFFAADRITIAAAETEAHVTQIIRDVKVLPANLAPRQATINEVVKKDGGVRTGGTSLSELTFMDLTITRLGENTIFSLNGGSRNVNLDSGSVLLYVPKNSGGARITSSAVTVGISGTTVIFEPSRTGRNKLTVLEGGARLTLKKYPRESSYIGGGWMLDVPAGATKIPPPIRVDLNRLMKTSPLIADFPPLPSQNLIAVATNNQNPPAYPVQPVSGYPAAAVGGLLPLVPLPIIPGVGGGSGRGLSGPTSHTRHSTTTHTTPGDYAGQTTAPTGSTGTPLRAPGGQPSSASGSRSTYPLPRKNISKKPTPSRTIQ